ncbi:hypothetical protein HZA33_00680 [Candidatus Pacearchaeota archaeon]|nr:hypothetical protein [Candidatus Pacearchaeota archaeon]
MKSEAARIDRRIVGKDPREIKLDEILGIKPGQTEQSNADDTQQQDSTEGTGISPIIIPQSAGLEQLVQAYDDFLRERARGGPFNSSQLAQSYTPTQIHDFLKKMKEYEAVGQFVDSGIFLSYLLQRCSVKDLSLELDFSVPLSSVASNINYKEIAIKGDVGNMLGYEAKDSGILVGGNAENYVGQSIKNSHIEINGSVGDNAGAYMENGEIIIHGNFGASLGYQMQNGRIKAEGSYNQSKLPEIGKGMTGGEIYLNLPNFAGGLIGDVRKGKIYNRGKIVCFK